MFSVNTDYWNWEYRTDISKIKYNEFAYLTDDNKNKVEYLSDWSIKTVWNKNEWFSEWVEEYTLWNLYNSSPRGVWYYYTDLEKSSIESISIWANPYWNLIWYRSMWGERLLSWINWSTNEYWTFYSSRSWTNMPFWKRHDIYNWCYWWKNPCREDWWSEWASLWLR